MAADQGPAVAVTVDGVAWTVVERLEGHAPESRAVAVETTPAGWVVTFGDGVHGRRPPTGAKLRITYAGGARRPVEVRLGRSVPRASPDAASWTVIRSDEQGLEFAAPPPPSGQAGKGAPAWRFLAALSGVVLLSLLLWCWLIR